MIIPPYDYSAKRGRVMVVASAVFFSLTGVFVKLIPADGWTIVVLRGVFITMFFGGLLMVRKRLAEEIDAFRGAAWVATFFAAVSGTAFILAFKHTSVANVALIYATAPFLAAVIAWTWFAERPRPVVMVAGMVSLLGVAIIMRDSTDGGGIFGDVLALVMTLGMASYLCIYRRFPETPVTLPLVLANLVPLFVTLLIKMDVTVNPNDLWLIALFSLSFCAAALLLAEGSKWISPAESALLSALETPLAPVFAFLMLNTIPSSSTMLGGAIIMCAGFVALVKR